MYPMDSSVGKRIGRPSAARASLGYRCIRRKEMSRCTHLAILLATGPLQPDRFDRYRNRQPGHKAMRIKSVLEALNSSQMSSAEGSLARTSDPGTRPQCLLIEPISTPVPVAALISEDGHAE
jgi:hypothetical protein